MLDYHELPDGRRFPRVTSILQALAQPDLAARAARQERALVVQHAAALRAESPGLSAISFGQVLADRLPKISAAESFRDGRAEIGSQVHEAIAAELLGQPGTPVDLEAAQVIGNWRAWAAEVNLEAQLVEHRVISERFGYAGTLDLAGSVTLNGRRWPVVIDWKSGAHSHRARLQLSAYRRALIDTRSVVPETCGLVVRLPHTPGGRVSTWLLPPAECDAHFGVFTALRVVALWQDTVTREPEPMPAPARAPRPLATAAPVFSFASAPASR